jgi:hypothetical protein
MKHLPVIYPSCIRDGRLAATGTPVPTQRKDQFECL